MHNHQKSIIFATSSNWKGGVDMNEKEEMLKDLVESLRNYGKIYPKSKQLEQYILGLVYDIMDYED